MGIQLDNEMRACRKRIAQSAEQRACKKADRFAADQRLHLAVESAIEHITAIIDEVAEEHNKSFETISALVHLGGTVLKQHRAPTIQNALSYCWACINDGRCKSSSLLTLHCISLLMFRRG